MPISILGRNTFAQSKFSEQSLISANNNAKNAENFSGLELQLTYKQMILQI
jgi:hypothetical protein